jgi:hypothetical protein
MNSNEIAQRIEQINERCIQVSGDSRALNITMCCFGLEQWSLRSDLPKIFTRGHTAEEVFSKMEEELSRIEMRQSGMAKELGMEYAR